MDPAAKPNGRRVAAALIDFAILFVAFIAWGVAFGDSQASGGNASVHMNGLPALVFFVLALLYYVVSEAAMAGTPGKRMLGLEVIRDDGSRLGLGRSLGRNLLRIVDWLPLGYIAGLITMLVTDGSKRLGDIAAKSSVRRRA